MEFGSREHLAELRRMKRGASAVTTTTPDRLAGELAESGLDESAQAEILENFEDLCDELGCS